MRDALYDERAPTRTGPVRPPTYYGEGPFDPPSSEDEDESLLQKETSRSLGTIERAGYAEPDATVCPHRSASDQEPQRPPFRFYAETVFVTEISTNIVGRSCGDFNRNRDRVRVHVQRDGNIRWQIKGDIGPHYERHLSPRRSESPLGTRRCTIHSSIRLHWV